MDNKKYDLIIKISGLDEKTYNEIVKEMEKIKQAQIISKVNSSIELPAAQESDTTKAQ